MVNLATPTSGFSAFNLKACAEFLTSLRNAGAVPTRNYSESDWKLAYEQARERGDTLSGAFVLSSLFSMKAKDLGLTSQTQRALLSYAVALDVQSALDKTTPTATALLAFLGVPQRTIDFLQRSQNILGQSLTPRDRIGGALRSFLRDYLWSAGPFAFRMIPALLARKRIKAMPAELERQISANEGLLASWGIPKDEFFDKVWQEHFSDASVLQARVKVSQRGTLMGPLSILVSLKLLGVLTGVHLHPTDAIGNRLSPSYDHSSYLADSQRFAGLNLQGKRVAYIADRSLVTSGIPFLGNTSLGSSVADPTNLRMVDAYRRPSRSFQGHLVGNVSELNAAIDASRDADIVIFNFHGSPGNFSLNHRFLKDFLPEVNPHRLKPGAFIVFLSCSVADRYSLFTTADPQQEPWIQFSERVLSGSGTAVASTNDISYQAVVAGHDARAIRNQGTMMLTSTLAFSVTLASLAIMEPLPSGSMALINSMRVYGREAGLRVYDAQTGRVQHFVSPNPR